MSTSDLVECVRAAIEETMRIAREAEQIATAGDLRGTPLRAVLQDGSMTMTEIAGIEKYADLVAPHAILRNCEADLRTVERHAPELIKTRSWCKHCERLWPCVDFLDRAAAYGIDVEESGS